MAKKPKEFPIGRVSGVFGLRGELKCDPTSAGRTLFSPGARLEIELGHGAGRENVRLSSVREHKGRLLVALDGVPDATAAERFAGATFFAARDELHVEDGEYLDVDLVGCRVDGREGSAYGTVERVEHYPANDMLIVGGKMLPMVRAFIVDIDTASKRIVVDVPAGLLDGDAEEVP